MPDGTHPPAAADRPTRTVDLTAARHSTPDRVVTAAVDALDAAPTGAAVTLYTPLEHGHPGQYLFLPLLDAFGTALEVEYEGERADGHVSTVVRREGRR